MYPEFIAIYVMLAIVILMLAVLTLLVLKLVISSGKSKNSAAPAQNANMYSQQNYQQYSQQQYQQPYQAQSQGGNIVFCRHCATQYDASQSYCPRCGSPR